MNELTSVEMRMIRVLIYAELEHLGSRKDTIKYKKALEEIDLKLMNAMIQGAKNV